MKHVHIPMYEGEFYHVYNRGNNFSPIFYTEANFNFFLYKLRHYLQTYLNFYAFNLLRSEFHLIVSVKDFNSIPEELRSINKAKNQLFKPSEIISEQFRKFFICYAKAINKQEKNTGSVFEKNFERSRIANQSKIKKLICEIHNRSDPFYYSDHSSRASIIDGKECFVNRNEILNWFGGVNGFVNAHIPELVYNL
jgi:putative transposase